MEPGWLIASSSSHEIESPKKRDRSDLPLTLGYWQKIKKEIFHK